MILYLDSTNNTQTILRLDGQEYIREVTSPRDQDVFGFLVQTLKGQNHSLRDITEIKVNSGPGTFTGTRIGVSIANALGFALHIPVNGSFDPVVVNYSAPPSITTPKR